jgi:hypothetical protein
VRTETVVAAAVRDLREAQGPVFIAFKVAAENLPLVLPPREGVHLKQRFRAALLGAGPDA